MVLYSTSINIDLAWLLDTCLKLDLQSRILVYSALQTFLVFRLYPVYWMIDHMINQGT
jgi:hypothetical protein